MILFTRSTSVRSTSVYSPRGESVPSSRLSNCTAPRMAPSGLGTSWASPTPTPPAHPRAPPREGGGHGGEGPPPPPPPLHAALGLRAALAGGERLAEPAHH